MFRNIFSLSLLVMLIVVISGCSENMNPVTPEEDGQLSSFAEVKQATLPTNDTTKVIRVIRAVSATNDNGVAAGPSLINSENGDDLEFTLEHEVNDSSVSMTMIAEDGAFVSYDYIKVYVGDTYLGRIRVPKGAYWSEIEIAVEVDDLPSNKEITLTVKVERGGEVIAEEETDTFEIETSVKAKVESVKADGRYFIVELDTEVEVTSSRSARQNITVTDEDGEELDVTRVREGDEDDEITIRVNENITEDVYTITYSGEGGLETADGDDIAAFSHECEVEVEEEEDDDDDDNDDDDTVAAPAVWKTVTIGNSSAHGAVRAAVLSALGVQTSVNADYLIRNEINVADDEESIDLYKVTLPSDVTTVGQAISHIVNAGYQLVSNETAYALRKAYTGQPTTEHLLVLSPFMSNASGVQSLLVVTGHGMTLMPGDGLVSHGFSAGLHGTIDNTVRTVIVTR